MSSSTTPTSTTSAVQRPSLSSSESDQRLRQRLKASPASNPMSLEDDAVGSSPACHDATVNEHDSISGSRHKRRRSSGRSTSEQSITTPSSWPQAPHSPEAFVESTSDCPSYSSCIASAGHQASTSAPAESSNQIRSRFPSLRLPSFRRNLDSSEPASPSSRPALPRNATTPFAPEQSPVIGRHIVDDYFDLDNATPTQPIPRTSSGSNSLRSFSESLDRQRAIIEQLGTFRTPRPDSSGHDIQADLERLRADSRRSFLMNAARDEHTSSAFSSELWGEFQQPGNDNIDPYMPSFPLDSRSSGNSLGGRMRGPTYRRNERWLRGLPPQGEPFERTQRRETLEAASRRAEESLSASRRSISRYMLQHRPSPAEASDERLRLSGARTTSEDTSSFEEGMHRRRSLYRPSSSGARAEDLASDESPLHFALPRLSYQPTRSPPVMRRNVFGEDGGSDRDSRMFFPDPEALLPTLDSNEGWSDSHRPTGPRPTLFSRPSILRRRRPSSSSNPGQTSPPSSPRSPTQWFTRSRLTPNLARRPSTTSAVPATSERDDEFTDEPFSYESEEYFHEPPRRTTGLLRSLSFRRRARRPSIGRGLLVNFFGDFEFPDMGNYMTDEELAAMDYTDLLQLADSVGPALEAHRLATQEDLDRSELLCCQAGTLKALPQGEMPSSETADRCLVCLDVYLEEDSCRILKCNHAFHKTCLDLWLTTGLNSCPLCRQVGCERVTPQPAPPTQDEDDTDILVGTLLGRV